MLASKLEADNQAAILRIEAEARLSVAKDKSQALMKESAAESAQANAMEGTRRHDEKLHMTSALKDVAARGHMVVSNKGG